MTRVALVPALCLPLLAASAIPALAQRQEPTRARLFLNGGFAVSSLDFSETRNYTLFAEGSVLSADYSASSGPGFEIGVQYSFYRGLGAAVSFAGGRRDETVSVRTGLPHPFFFDQKREVSGSADSLSYRETALHFDLVYAGRSGSLEYALFAGLSRIKVETDVVDRIEFSQSYPFDTATLTGLPLKRLEDTPTGFNLGASLDYVLSRNFGLGAQLRFSRATARLVPAEGASLELDAGGLQIAGGVRVFF